MNVQPLYNSHWNLMDHILLNWVCNQVMCDRLTYLKCFHDTQCGYFINLRDSVHTKTIGSGSQKTQ